MANLHAISGANEIPACPAVRRIGLADLQDSVVKGVDDFLATPTQLGFLAIIYPLVGFFFARLAFGYDVLPLLFPLVAGYALIGPFAATGLYELSRRREQGEDVSWTDAFSALRCPSLDAIGALGLVLMAVFLVWLATATWLYQSLFGATVPESLSQFMSMIFFTTEGWTLIIAGHSLGLVFAVMSLAIGAISFPMLLDRDVGAVTALQTSVRVMIANPLIIAVWGLFVAATLALGSLPLFIGLAVAMPVLAHATWHLYRKAVEPVELSTTG